ncbi:hypothetical protein UPYG_G00097630 [Umbra pygmaea]|uniref:Plexin domain-containing protein 1 n=1 Tax=Umbra pygmaea TaxID=75934 RepID=A0ABD0X074_UMBPY
MARGTRYDANGYQPVKPLETNRSPREQRLHHTRVVREVLEGVTIDTLPDNITHLEESGRYYSLRSFGPDDQRADELWVDLNNLQHGQVRMHGILSNTHKQAARVALSFKFPFYGHYLRQITIATGGFIFMGDVTHRMLTTTQYIAPLMANFDPSFSKESTVQYLDNGEVFVVQWERVRLHGREADGAYTFQAALYQTGTITFSYRDIPLPVELISSPEHLVKAGLSDAFMVNLPSQQHAGAQLRTIYEYHRVDVDTAMITNHSAFEFTALPTCLQHDNCDLCLTSTLTSGCIWCNVLQRCSDGMDRHRQEWLDYGCSLEAKDVTCEDYFVDGPESTVGPSVPSGSDFTTPLGSLLESPTMDVDTGHPRQHNSPVQTGVIVGVVAALVILLALTLLALYMNSHPIAASPIYLLQRGSSYWPSMKFRKQGFSSRFTDVGVEEHEGDGIIEAGQC